LFKAPSFKAFSKQFQSLFSSLSTTAGKLSKAEKVAAKRAAALAMLDKAEAEEQKRRKGQPAEESEDEEEGESDEDEVSRRYISLV
jgi:hypothetical protein